MTGALIVLPRTVDDDGDTTEVLQAADVDRGGRVVAAVLKRHAGHVIENIGQAIRLQSLYLLQRHDAHRRERIDSALFGFRCGDRDGIKRLDRRAADLRPRIEGRRCSGLVLRFRRLAFGLLLFLPLGGASDSFSIACLRETET